MPSEIVMRRCPRGRGRGSDVLPDALHPQHSNTLPTLCPESAGESHVGESKECNLRACLSIYLSICF